MSAVSQTSTPQTGMWAPYEPPEIGEPLDVLEQVDAFVLVDVKVREAVATQYGPRDAVDLTVATTDPGKTRCFSGFSAGIVGQSKRVEAGNLPALCRVVPQTSGRGTTRGLELVQLLVPGADVAAIAKAQRVPIAPLNGQTNEIPY